MARSARRSGPPCLSRRRSRWRPGRSLPVAWLTPDRSAEGKAAANVACRGAEPQSLLPFRQRRVSRSGAPKPLTPPPTSRLLLALLSPSLLSSLPSSSSYLCASVPLCEALFSARPQPSADHRPAERSPPWLSTTLSFFLSFFFPLCALGALCGELSPYAGRQRRRRLPGVEILRVEPRPALASRRSTLTGRGNPRTSATRPSCRAAHASVSARTSARSGPPARDRSSSCASA